MAVLKFVFCFVFVFVLQVLGWNVLNLLFPRNDCMTVKYTTHSRI